MKKIYCIVVTYNGIHWISKCLTSLLESSYPLHVVVIDNASTDQTPSVIRNTFPQVQFIESKKNLGFGQANNIGLSIAIEQKADHVFLLNQDAWVQPGTIAALIHTQTENPDFGIISPVHLTGAGTHLDTYFSEYLVQSQLKYFLNAILLEKNSYPLLIQTSFVNAAAWLISSACLQKTGGFDAVFFHYGEDRNYTQRVLFNGFKIGIHTQAKIYHDREQRISTPATDEKQRLKKEKIHFLNQVCDPAQANYKRIIRRRLLRYTLYAFKNFLLFNKKEFAYNYGMARMIVSSISGITKSRKSSLMASSIPHLASSYSTFHFEASDREHG